MRRVSIRGLFVGLSGAALFYGANYTIHLLYSNYRSFPFSLALVLTALIFMAGIPWFFRFHFCTQTLTRVEWVAWWISRGPYYLFFGIPMLVFGMSTRFSHYDKNFIRPLQLFMCACSVNAIVRFDKRLDAHPDIEIFRRDFGKALQFIRNYVDGDGKGLPFIDIWDGAMHCGHLYPELCKNPIPDLVASLKIFQYHKRIIKLESSKAYSAVGFSLQQLLLSALACESAILASYGIKEENTKGIGFKYNPQYDGLVPLAGINSDYYFPEILLYAQKINASYAEEFDRPLMPVSSGFRVQPLGPDDKPVPAEPSPDTPPAKINGDSTPGAFGGPGQKKQDLSSYLDKYDLTEQQRKCISLRMEYGLEPREIGERLGITRQRVDQHLKRAEDRMNNFNANDRKRRGANKGIPSCDAAENDY